MEEKAVPGLKADEAHQVLSSTNTAPPAQAVEDDSDPDFDDLDGEDADV